MENLLSWSRAPLVLEVMMRFMGYLNWQPTIGDPTFMGWVTVWAYALAAFLTARVAKKTSPNIVIEHSLSIRRIWICVSVLMCFLCINKQLDLQSLFTAIARVIFKENGWYKERRDYQVFFILFGLGFLVTFAITFIRKYPSFWRLNGMLIGGLIFLLSFIGIRAISFHRIDHLIGTRLVSFKLNWILELTGIFLVGLSAARELRKLRKK